MYSCCYNDCKEQLIKIFNMKKLILKTLFKLSLTLIVIISVCELTGMHNFNNTSNLNTKAQPKEEEQYIPPHLDYSDVIKSIKEEEGVEEDEEEAPQEIANAPEEVRNDDYMLTKDEEPSNPSEYMDKARFCVRTAVQAKDETTRIRYVRKALECYLRYLKYYEGDLDALLGAGTTATFLGKETQARHLLMEAYATYPQNPNVHKALGDYCFKFNNFNNAIEYYNLSLLSGNLKDYNTNIATAVCYEKLGDIEKAIAYYKVAQHINPSSPIANQRLEMYAAMERDGYQTDSRLYNTSQPNDEQNDVELETLMLDSQRIK